MAPGAKLAEVFLERGNGSEKIGDNDEEAAFVNQFGDALQRFFDMSFFARGLFFEGEHELAKMTGATVYYPPNARFFMGFVPKSTLGAVKAALIHVTEGGRGASLGGEKRSRSTGG